MNNYHIETHTHDKYHWKVFDPIYRGWYLFETYFDSLLFLAMITGE